MKRTLVYFSSCALDGAGKPDTFLLQELPWLLMHFDRVLVCSYYGIAQVTQPAPAHIEVKRPALGELRAKLAAPFSRDFWAELRRMRRGGRSSPGDAARLLIFTVRGRMMRNWAQACLKPGEQATFYSLWMSYDGYAAALCKRARPASRAVARAHAFDIDVARNPLNPYLMKRAMVSALDGVYPISEGAKACLQAYIALPEDKTAVVGMGSAGEPPQTRFPAPFFSDGVLRIVSCSALVPIKRVPLLVDALALWPGGRLRWLHIGGGPQEAELRAYAAQKLGERHEIDYTLTGTLPPERVHALYETQPFDVFVNTSENEGVPVAIMEAMREGLPVVAPAVGGIPELVDAQTGVLYPPQAGAQAVLAALLTVRDLPPARAEAMRQAAQHRWAERCQSGALLARLFPEAAGEAARS